MRRPVIIVDDEDDLRYLMSDLLRAHGYEVEAVACAEDCLRRLSIIPACVVVTDIQMPSMSGLELCGLIRERHPGTATIVMSGATNSNVAQEALRQGASAFLPKPVKFKLLETTIALIMARAS